MSNIKLDCKNMSCPAPIIEVSKAIKEINTGDVLEVEATDQGFEPDIQAWSKQTGHELISLDVGDVLKAVIRKV